MTFTEVREAQLFRLLSGFFGRERVIPNMSVMCVCGGEPPADLRSVRGDLELWMRRNKCLFTIVDEEDKPKLVVEFFSGTGDIIDAVELEHQAVLPQLLGAAGIRYITVSVNELAEILDPKSTIDFFSLLEAKVMEQVDA
ncbi:MAG: hypothetical protein K1X79_13035 [Oligoflexia bacterium]|nr:hypothetical protein [Oligoflexia bacterium]